MNLLLNEQELPITAATEECTIQETAVWRRNVSIYALCSCKHSSIVVLDMVRGSSLRISDIMEKGIFFQFCPTILNVVCLAKSSML